MADWQGSFVAVDWGTTNRRAYAIGTNGRVSAHFEDDRGVLAIPANGFDDAVTEIRSRLGTAPMLLAGMVGSNRGWSEVPYVAIPASLADLAVNLTWMHDDIAIVPGLCRHDDRYDVMRGEEIQALGAVAAGSIGADARVCHPGTHAKWIDMRAGRVESFSTAMTGEMFALLRDHSILKFTGDGVVGDAFNAGADAALSGEPFLDALFGVRSRVVLGALDPTDVASYVSGLVVGADVASHCEAGETIALLGRPELCALYAAVLARRGCASATTDGAGAFVAGMNALRKLLP